MPSPMQEDERHVTLPGTQPRQPQCGQPGANLAEPSLSTGGLGSSAVLRRGKVLSQTHQLPDLGKRGSRGNLAMMLQEKLSTKSKVVPGPPPPPHHPLSTESLTPA